MRVRTARDLGRTVRGERTARAWPRKRLAEEAGVSPRWLIAFENGKSGAEVGLVLRCLDALELTVDVARADPGGSAAGVPPIDLDAHLALIAEDGPPGG